MDIINLSMEALNEICLEVKNFFVQEIHTGQFKIEEGNIVPSLPITTKYYRIVGSALNDGVHCVDDADLIDEPEFDGAIWTMSPLKGFLLLVDEIDTWRNENAGALNSPYSSESFGGYSYSKANGGNVTWQSQFANRLKPYRRIRIL